MDAKPVKKGNGKGYGKLITDRVPTVAPTALVSDVEQLLLEQAKQFDSIHYVYVLDAEKKLRGVISVKDVFRQPKAMPIERFMQKAVVQAKVGTHPERIAYIALRHNIKAIPMVGKDGVFQGVVPGDVILKTLHHEMSEDIFRFAGVPGAHKHATGYDDVLHLSLPRTLFHRLPWLIVGLIGGIGISKIIGAFDGLLAEHIILASFVPLVVYMADANATQANAFIIRDLAVGAKIKFGAYFFKEFKNDFAIAAITAMLFFGTMYGLGYPFTVGSAVSVAMFFAVLSSIGTGILVPYTLSRLRLDPANGTGPLATILQDGLSVAIYFSVASLFF